MMKPESVYYQKIEGDSMNWMSTVQEAIAQAMAGPNRAVKFGVNNKTPFGIEIGFGQIKRTASGNDWIGDTGVFTFLPCCC